jgi:hypothetical protein
MDKKLIAKVQEVKKRKEEKKLAKDNSREFIDMDKYKHTHDPTVEIDIEIEKKEPLYVQDLESSYDSKDSNITIKTVSFYVENTTVDKKGNEIKDVTRVVKPVEIKRNEMPDSLKQKLSKKKLRKLKSGADSDNEDSVSDVDSNEESFYVLADG